MINPECRLSLAYQGRLLGLARASLYYEPETTSRWPLKLRSSTYPDRENCLKKRNHLPRKRSL